MMKSHGIGRILAVMGVLGMTVFFFFVNPIHCVWLPPCMFHKLTGLHCPGCGSTRAFYSLAHGNLVDAIRFNPLAMTALAAGAVLVFWQRGRVISQKPWFAWLVVTVVLVFGIVRNIPAYPFVMLKP